MFNAAVVCTDLSDASDSLLAVAHRLRQFGVSRVVLACVCDPDSSDSESNVREGLLKQQGALASRGFEVDVVTRVGASTTSVDEIADEAGADIVMVGVHGLGRMAKLLVGGSTDESADGLRHPLLSVRVGGAGGASMQLLTHVPMLSKVLLATDFTDASESATATAEGLVRSGAVDEIVVFYVSQERYTTAEERLAMRRVADRMRAANSTVRVTEDAGFGQIAEAIMNRAHSGDVTLTIVGSRGHGLHSDSVVGSVGAEVARHIQGPLLAVPAPSAADSALRSA